MFAPGVCDGFRDKKSIVVIVVPTPSAPSSSGLGHVQRKLLSLQCRQLGTLVVRENSHALGIGFFLQGGHLLACLRSLLIAGASALSQPQSDVRTSQFEFGRRLLGDQVSEFREAALASEDLPASIRRILRFF